MPESSIGDVPPGGARVYYAMQDDLDSHVRAEYMALLSRDEWQRHGRFRFERDRDLYVLAHGMLRLVLARHAGVSPRALSFVAGTHGRPELSGPSKALPLRFNLTHTRGLAACVVARGQAVGVDAERLTRDVDVRALSARVFSSAERKHIDERSGAAARARFFVHWTLKEAYIKAIGQGLSMPLRRITTTPIDDDNATLELTDMDDDASRWVLRMHRVGGEHQLAVALAAEAGALVTFERFRLA